MASSVEELVEKVFGVDCNAINRHFKSTSDRTVWYKTNINTNTMFTPDMRVLKVNQQALESFLSRAEVFIKYPLDDPIFDWSNLNLLEANDEVSIKRMFEMLNDSCGNDKYVAADTETKYLRWDNNKLLAIGFATDDNTAVAMYNLHPKFYDTLQKFLNRKDIKFIWHNGKFDRNFLKYTCGITARIDEDTMLKHFVQVSEKKGTHGLKYLGPLYLQAPQWDDALDEIKKKYCRSHKVKLSDFTYDLIPTDVLIPYLQRDCIATYRLLGVLDSIKEEGTDWIYYQLIRASEVFSQMELNGAMIDTKQLEYLEEKFNSDLKNAQSLINNGVAELWNPIEYSKQTGAAYVATFNPNSPKQLKWMLQKATGMTLDSTDAATIEKLLDVAEGGTVKFSDATLNLIKGIQQSRVASKYLDTYVVGLGKEMCSDQRIRGTYNLHGTETGRLSSSNPNMQNIPTKNKDVKNLFVAAPGYKLLQLDQSQAELRTMGLLSGDKFLIDAYMHDRDLHSAVAEEIFGKDFTKLQRRMAKTVNFGIAFGRGPGAIAEAFGLSMVEARQIVNNWFASMPEASKYIKGQRLAARRGDRLQTLFGRVRHFVVNDENMFHIENEYINTPIQSLASDITLIAIMDMYDWLVEEGLYDPDNIEASLVRLIITVHDSVVLEVYDDAKLIEQVAAKCKFFMEDVTRRLIENCPLPFKADVESGYSWGNLKEYEVPKTA